MVVTSLLRAVEQAGAALTAASGAYVPQVARRERGRVVAVRDGVLRICGLPGARAEELLWVGDNVPAVVLDLAPGTLLAAALAEPQRVREGDAVEATGRELCVPVGPELLGRVVDPLGFPLDGLPTPRCAAMESVERAAPPIAARAAVREPLSTGLLAIDAMFPIGRGQRELILGDKGSGRTTVALTALLRQAAADVVGLYVAIGRRRAEVWRVVDRLAACGGRWIVVSAPDDAPAGARYLAAFSATTMAEYFRDRGGHALVVYDDLSAHAVAWRELSLLLGRPPGREAFPGDVFYLHARLLERATQLAPERGGGSLTALPIATTEDGRLSAYIPTNLISITDGQLVLSSRLFAAGQKPAVDAGLSVSRVGSRAQPPAIRRLAGRLRLDYASYLELEAFSRVGARLEASAQRRLDVGERQRQLLRAAALQPLSALEALVRLALASDADALLRIPTAEVGPIAEQLAAEVRRAQPDLAGRLEAVTASQADDLDLRASVQQAVALRFGGEDA